MTRQLKKIEKYYAGDTLIQELQLTDEDNPQIAYKDIENAEVSWKLQEKYNGRDLVLDDSHELVSVDIVDGKNGRVDIAMLDGSTSDLGGQYLQTLQIKTDEDHVSSFQGLIAIRGL